MNIEIIEASQKRENRTGAVIWALVKSLPTICLPWIGQQSRLVQCQDRAVCADLHGSCKSGSALCTGNL